MKQHVRAIRYAVGEPGVRAGLWALLASLLALAAVAAYWWPAANERDRLHERIASQRRELVLSQQAADLLRAYRHAEAVVLELEAKLAQAPSQGQLVGQLGGLARRHGVRVLSEAYEEKKRDDRTPALVAELVVVGDYAAVRNMIGGLATLSGWSEIDELRLEQAAGGGSLRGRLRIVTYRPSANATDRGQS